MRITLQEKEKETSITEESIEEGGSDEQERASYVLIK